MREENDALALTTEQLKRFGNDAPLFLIPASENLLKILWNKNESKNILTM